MKILQLINDWVFDNSVLHNFSVMKTRDVENRFVVLRASADKELRKIEFPQLVDVVQTDSEEYELLKSEPFDVIWVHALTDIKANFILSLVKRPIIMWSTWGYDYVRFANRWLYGPRTTRLWLRATSFKSAIKTLFTYMVAQTPWVRFLPHLHCRFFRVVDFYSTVIPDEETLLSGILGPSARRLAFHYASGKVREMRMPFIDLDVKRIWVGNSATLTNNHLDVFPILEKYPDFEIHVPFSYSTTASDKIACEVIEKEGYNHFGKRFSPHKEFLPLGEYVKLMSGCSVFVFAHRRQQSVGNLSIALRMGGCVVMDESNPVFRYVKRNGIVAYTLTDLKRYGLSWLLKDFKPIQQINVERALKLWDYDKMEAEIFDTVDKLAEEVAQR